MFGVAVAAVSYEIAKKNQAIREQCNLINATNRLRDLELLKNYEQMNDARRAEWELMCVSLRAQIEQINLIIEGRRKKRRQELFNNRGYRMNDRMERRRQQIVKRNWMVIWMIAFWLCVPPVAVAVVAVIWRACSWAVVS